MLIKIYLCTTILSFLSFDGKNCGNTMNKKITIIGIAVEATDGAIVKTDRDKYFLDGLCECDDKYYGKKVKITGRLIIEIHKLKSTYAREFQEEVGNKVILKKLKWSLVELNSFLVLYAIGVSLKLNDIY